MNVYVLTTGEYSCTEIVGIFATLEEAQGIIPLATWRALNDGAWCAETDDGRDWTTTHWWSPAIHEHALLGRFAVDALLHDYDAHGPRAIEQSAYADEVPAPPPPPRCDYRENLSANSGMFCGLELGHDGPHDLHVGYFTSYNMTTLGQVPGS